jgi:hypothetical protein
VRGEGFEPPGGSNIYLRGPRGHESARRLIAPPETTQVRFPSGGQARVGRGLSWNRLKPCEIADPKRSRRRDYALSKAPEMDGR